ncbi:MAG: repair protein RadC protein [Parcubacteria group bacterium GW2011_GWA1_51_12]|nr:MAG: repair protein RadC protein [Parcubacteria group bacterium GW2011_GWA1_51_12]
MRKICQNHSRFTIYPKRNARENGWLSLASRRFQLKNYCSLFWAAALLASRWYRGIAGESVVVTAQKLLTQFGSLQKLSEASIEELSSVKGIGPAKATQIKAAFEIGRRLSTQTPAYKSKELTDPKKVYRLIKSKLKDYHKEHFYIIALNSRGHSIAEISVGSLDTSIVHPREVFAEAIKNKAASVIFAHNHPSGNTEPSSDDLLITKRLVEAGKIMGIEVVDHIIITKNSYLSFREERLI